MSSLALSMRRENYFYFKGIRLEKVVASLGDSDGKGSARTFI